MREILFRGKDKETGEWVEGYLYVRHDGVREISCYNEDVNIERWTSQVTNESVGQYTGLNDKNGKRIFEGDILQHGYKRLVVWWNGESFQWQAKEKRDGYTFTFDGKNLDVTWDNIDLGWIACETACTGKMTTQVIGNIHDNPELLKEG